MPWSEKFCWVDPRQDLPKITNAKGEEAPTSFFDYGSKHILVKGKIERYAGEPEYHCPRCGEHGDAIEVSTTAGIWLYCFGCKIFYPEGGNWGYKY